MGADVTLARMSVSAELQSGGRALSVVVAFAAALWAGVEAAQAHRPYLTDLQAITLPDGKSGQIGIVNGDGIFFADPAWVAVFANGRAVARSGMSVPWTLSCKPAEPCRAVQPDAGLALELDPANFRHDVLVGDPTKRENLRVLAIGNASWGFKARPATFTERMGARAEMAARYPGTVGFLVICGFVLCSLLTEALPAIRKAKPLQVLLLAVLVAVRAVGAAFVLSVAVYALLLTGLSVRIWAASLLAGSMIAVLLPLLFQALRSPQRVKTSPR